MTSETLNQSLKKTVYPSLLPRSFKISYSWRTTGQRFYLSRYEINQLLLFPPILKLQMLTYAWCFIFYPEDHKGLGRQTYGHQSSRVGTTTGIGCDQNCGKSFLFFFKMGFAFIHCTATRTLSKCICSRREREKTYAIRLVYHRHADRRFQLKKPGIVSDSNCFLKMFHYRHEILDRIWTSTRPTTAYSTNKLTDYTCMH